MTRDELVELSEIPPSMRRRADDLRRQAAIWEERPTAFETPRMGEARNDLIAALRKSAEACDAYGNAVWRVAHGAGA